MRNSVAKICYYSTENQQNLEMFIGKQLEGEKINARKEGSTEICTGPCTTNERRFFLLDLPSRATEKGRRITMCPRPGRQNKHEVLKLPDKILIIYLI